MLNEKFLDGAAVTYKILNIHKLWFTKSFYQSALSEWLNNKELGLYEIEEASNNYNKWWKNKESTIFISCQYKNSQFYLGTAFAANYTVLKRLESKGFSTYSIYPYNITYDFENKYAVIDNPKELYYFNEKLYRTCDSNHIKIQHINEPSDILLYLAGKKDFNVVHPIQEFLNKFSKFDLEKDAFDDSLVKYAAENNSESILKLIDYLTEVDYKSLWHMRTVSESDVYMLIAGEYFRRLIEFCELEHIKAMHPLYAYGLDIPGVPQDVNTEALFRKQNKLDPYTYKTAFVIACLKYMKLAQEGNEIASRFYKVFEPVLLFFAAGGEFSKEHGYFTIGGATIGMNGWISHAGKMPFDIYKEIPKAWSMRHFNYSLHRIKRIKWSKVGVLSKLPEPQQNKGLGKLKVFFKDLVTTDNTDYSQFLYLARKLGGESLSNITTLCSNLIEVENTLIRCICESYLEWSALIDAGNSEALKNPCLYEPFIDLFIEGGNLTQIHIKTLELIEVMKNKPITSYFDFCKQKEHRKLL